MAPRRDTLIAAKKGMKESRDWQEGFADKLGSQEDELVGTSLAETIHQSVVIRDRVSRRHKSDRLRCSRALDCTMLTSLIDSGRAQVSIDQ